MSEGFKMFFDIATHVVSAMALLVFVLAALGAALGAFYVAFRLVAGLA